MALTITWHKATNEVFRLAGIPEIPTEADFNSDGTLRPEQKVGKYLIRLAQQHLSLRVEGEFKKHRIELNLMPGQNIYYPDIDFAPGSIVPLSVFDTSSGGTGRRLENWAYNEFKEVYPSNDLNDLPTGKPTRWIYTRDYRSDGLNPGGYALIFFPTPDSARRVEYQAKLNAKYLNTASDLIFWPEPYLHALYEWAWHMVERDLGEGKEGIIMQLAQQAFKDVRIADYAPSDVRRVVRTMPPFPQRGSRRWYSSESP